METPLDEMEKSAWQSFFKEFPLEALAIMGNLLVFTDCVGALVHSQPHLQQLDFVGHLRKSSGEERCNGVWSVLMLEASKRLYVARLLLFTGHQSRCLASIRDAYECLRWGDVCFKDGHQASLWLAGKDVTARKGHVYNDLLSDTKSAKIQKVLNTEGTHAYLKACLISLHSMSGEQSSYCRMVTQFSIVALMSMLDTAIGYTLNMKPDLRKTVAIDPALVLLLKACYDKNLKSLEEGGYFEN